MAIIIWPVDAVTGAPSYTGRSLREALAPLLAGATAARPLGARSGVRPGTSATTVTATSTVWTINACAGILDLETAAEAGPYAFAINTAQTGAVTAAHATLPRVDIVWVRLDDPAESDGSSVPAVVAGYTAGTAASSPAAPATPARCMVLATIQVPASGGGSPTVIWVAPYAVAAGGIIPVSAGVYPATPYVGQYVDDATLGLLRWNGTAWAGGAPSTATLLFTPGTNFDTPASGAATWLTLGNITVPSWATKCAVVYAINGVWDGGGTANVHAVMKIGSVVGGVDKRLEVPGVISQRFNFSVMDAFTGLTPGVQSVTIFATFVGGAMVRADTTSYMTAQFIFQP